MPKPNALLAKRDAAMEAMYFQKMQICSEIDTLAMMLMLHNTLAVGKGRADKCLNDYLAYKMEIADTVMQDSKDDKEILHTKRDLANQMKEIFGPDWEKCREMFPLLKQYW